MQPSPGHSPFHTSPGQDQVLDQILRHAQQAPPGSVAILDLDGCLFDNRHRHVRILLEFASRENIAPLYSLRVEHVTDWDLRHSMSAAGLDQRQIEEIYPKVRKTFMECFLSDAYVCYDQAMPGAVDLVSAVQAHGVQIIYLTGRHEEMRSGTETALRRFGFPIDAPGVQLMCKPNREMADDVYKLQALARIEALGTPVLLMENEPRHVNFFTERYPEALVVFVATDHSPLPDRPLPHLPVIRSFLRHSCG